MREYELGQLLVNDLLPEDMRDYNRVISKGTIGKLMTELAKKHPDQYKEVSHKLLQLGYQAAYLTNGDSFTLKDMSPTAISKKMQKELNKEVQDILAKARSKGIKTNDPKVNKAIIDACIKWSKKSDEGTSEESNFDTNALYRQAQKTGVGAQKPGTYKSIRTGDVLYVDQNNKPVPIPVTHSYAQGLRPAEYFAGAFGTRKGIVDLQKATQDAGYLCAAETELVMLYDFTSKAIKDIEVGDYVLGIEDNLDKPKYKPVKVTHVFNNGLRDCYKTVFDKNVEFVSTLDHKILCNAGKVNNEVLPVGSKGIKAITINNEALSIKEQVEVGKLNTYDLEVDSPNHLFVLASGLIVHNSKQLVQIAHRLVVDSNDSDQPYDEKNPIGYPSTVDDPDNEGAMLSMPVAGYKRNTVLTPKILSDMKQKGVKNILVRSVIAGGPANGGIYAYDAGIRETGSLPAQGDFVGIKSVQAISEPITQSAISCLHPNTKVRMGDGTVKAIKDIKVGDIVLGADKQGYTAPVKVVNVFNNGVQPVYITVYRKSVKTNSVIAIAATKEHKALQITRKSNCKGEKYNNIIRELPIGEPGRHVSAVLARGPKEKREGKHENGALLLGLLLGDGCYTENVNRPCFSCADPSLIEELTEYMKSVDCRFAFHKGSQCYYRVSGLNNDGSGDNTRNPAKQLLLKYNMFGKYSFEKEIPEDVKNWDSDSVSALLSGLIITDGSIYKSSQAKHYHMSYASTSYKLVKQVKDLLYLHCGASCAKIHINKSSRKRYLYSIVYSKPAELLRVLNFIKLYGVKEPLRKTAIEECKALLTIQDYYACKRIKQVFYGNVETLDIEVDNEDHLFVLANGMVVSNSKHSGGVAGAESGKAISGFKYINQLIQVPKHFPGGATHATVDGKVERIRPAAQGGYYITVAGHDHYVRTDKGDETPILVKVGDEVEAGDVMSDGIPNPAMIVKYKGLGEGRRYFTNMFRDALDRAGTPVNRRNIETLSRGLISYVKLNSEIGDYSPDDILPYAMVAADYQPRDGYVAKEPKSCKGMYLEKPVLHYTIGTRITPKVIKELNDFGIKQVTCHKDPPPFESEMVRGMAHAASDPDWGTKMLGSYNKESLLESARLGAVSNTQGTSYVPALAFGDPTFGNTGATKQGAYELLKKAQITYADTDYINSLNPTDSAIYKKNIDIANVFNNLASNANVSLPDITLDPYTQSDFSTTRADMLDGITDINGMTPSADAVSNTTQDRFRIRSTEYDVNSLAHELGHTIDMTKNKNLYSIARYIPVVRRMDRIMHERGADIEARNFINKTLANNADLRNRVLTGYNNDRSKPLANYYKNEIPVIASSAIGGIAGAGVGGYAGYKGGNFIAKNLKLKNNSNISRFLRYCGAAAGAIGGAYLGDNIGASIGNNIVNMYRAPNTRQVAASIVNDFNNNYDKADVSWENSNKPGSKLVNDLINYTKQ